MTKKINTILLILVCLICLTPFTVSAQGSEAFYPPEEVMCIAYRGDTALYEQNSKEAVLSAFEKGADFVSVNIMKDGGGELVLCSENAVEVKGSDNKDQKHRGYIGVFVFLVNCCFFVRGMVS